MPLYVYSRYCLLDWIEKLREQEEEYVRQHSNGAASCHCFLPGPIDSGLEMYISTQELTRLLKVDFAKPVSQF